MPDRWFDRVVKPCCRGEAHLVLFADDFVVLFEEAEDARRFARVWPTRSAKFALTMAEEKTRLLALNQRAWTHSSCVPDSGGVRFSRVPV